MRWPVLFFFAASSVIACTLISNADLEQCETNADCAARGPEFANAVCVASRCSAPAPVEDSGSDAAGEDTGPPPKTGPWRCVGEPKPSPGTGTVNAVNHFWDLVSQAPYKQLELELCGAADVNCANPIAATTTNDNGDATFTFAANLDAFISATKAPAEAPDLLPAIFYSPYIPVPSGMPAPTRGMIRQRDLNFLATVGGIPIKDTEGYVLAVTTDCDNVAAAGVRVDVQAGSTVQGTRYLRNSLPTTSESGTIDFGIALVFDVKPGFVTITATRTATDSEPEALLTTRSVLVKAGVVTTLILSPSLP